MLFILCDLWLELIVLDKGGVREERESGAWSRSVLCTWEGSLWLYGTAFSPPCSNAFGRRRVLRRVAAGVDCIRPDYIGRTLKCIEGDILVWFLFRSGAKMRSSIMQLSPLVLSALGVCGWCNKNVLRHGYVYRNVDGRSFRNEGMRLKKLTAQGAKAAAAAAMNHWLMPTNEPLSQLSKL